MLPFFILRDLEILIWELWPYHIKPHWMVSQCCIFDIALDEEKNGYKARDQLLHAL